MIGNEAYCVQQQRIIEHKSAACHRAAQTTLNRLVAVAPRLLVIAQKFFKPFSK